MKIRLYNLLAIIAGTVGTAFALLWFLLTGDETSIWIDFIFVIALIAITGMKEVAESW